MESSLSGQLVQMYSRMTSFQYALKQPLSTPKSGEQNRSKNKNKPVSDEPEVREWLLGRSDLALRPGEEVGEVDEEPAIALPLVRRQSQDARHVEVLQARRLVIQCGREISGACYIK